MLKQTVLFIFILLFTSACDLSSLKKWLPGTTESEVNSSPDSKAENTSDKAQKRSKKRLPFVYSSTVNERSLSQKTTVSGTLEAYRHVNIFNQSEGMLVQLPFREGDQVKKNQVLARLDDTLIKIDHRKAVVNHQQAQLDLSRIKKLVPKSLVSKDEVSQAKTKVALAAAEEKKQLARLGYTTIKAPFTGTISARLKEPGDILPVHTHLMSIIDINRLKVKLPLSELFLPQVKLGDQVSLQIDALGKTIYQGTIIRKYPAIESSSRRGIVEVELSPTPVGAMPGQLCRVTLTSHPQTYTTIPLSAVRHDQKSAYVYRLDKEQSKVNKTPISIGQTIGNLVEVLDGLAIGEEVISKGQYGLSHGMSVKVVTPPEKNTL